jgi:hypothetical protein
MIARKLVITHPFSELAKTLSAQNLTLNNLKVVWAEFSTLSLAVFVVSATVCHRQARPNLKLKTQPRGHIFSHVQPFYERAVSNLDP